MTAVTTGAGVVIGGGLLGLEAANALRQFGLQTHVVEMMPRLMAQQIDEGGGALLAGWSPTSGSRCMSARVPNRSKPLSDRTARHRRGCA